MPRRFHADRPDRLPFTDITQRRTAERWVYCAAVFDVYSRRIVGWSIPDYLRTELVVDALEIARWRRNPSSPWSSPTAGPTPPGCSAIGPRSRILGSRDIDLRLEMQLFFAHAARAPRPPAMVTRVELANAIFNTSRQALPASPPSATCHRSTTKSR